MPELPEVETTVRGLASVLEGRALIEVTPRRADLRRAIPGDLRQRMTGAVVTHLGRRAKYGLIGTDRGDTLIFHLGMSGRWRINPEDLGKHDHLLIRTGDENRLTLNDPRRFGSLDLVDTAALSDFAPFLTMGPEPLGGPIYRRLSCPGIGRTDCSDQAAAARSANRCGPGEYLRLRGA